MSHRREMVKLLREAEREGCTVERTKGGHWRIGTPSGAVVIAAFSPRSPGGVQQVLRRLKREGVFR